MGDGPTEQGPGLLPVVVALFLGSDHAHVVC
jgi:hypothetical protein